MHGGFVTCSLPPSRKRTGGFCYVRYSRGAGRGLAAPTLLLLEKPMPPASRLCNQSTKHLRPRPALNATIEQPVCGGGASWLLQRSPCPRNICRLQAACIINQKDTRDHAKQPQRRLNDICAVQEAFWLLQRPPCSRAIIGYELLVFYSQLCSAPGFRGRSP